MQKAKSRRQVAEYANSVSLAACQPPQQNFFPKPRTENAMKMFLTRCDVESERMSFNDSLS